MSNIQPVLVVGICSDDGDLLSWGNIISGQKRRNLNETEDFV